MALRPPFSAAPGTLLLVALLAAPVLATNVTPSAPSPGPSLAPIGDSSEPDASASGAPGQPKVLGHIYASAYCEDFVEHFNTATQVIVDNDHHFDSVDKTLHAVEDDWNRMDGAMRVFDDRTKLIADVSAMVKTIPASQAAINQMLADAKTTTDPIRKAALQESASQLQTTLDRQRAVADDLTTVIHVLMDHHTKEDTVETQVNALLPFGYHATFDIGDDPVPAPGEHSMMQPKPTPSPSPGASATPSAVEDVMQWQRQRSIIADAEARAASAADRIVRICNDDRAPTPPPSSSVFAPQKPARIAPSPAAAPTPTP
jgi:hypothetical protein